MEYLLLLSGGAAKGAFQVPIVEHLVDKIGYPAHVAGTSIGAGNGAAVASKKIKKLRKLWNLINETSDFQSLNPDLWNGFSSLSRYKNMLIENDMLDIKDIKLTVGIVDLATARHRLIDLNPLNQEDRLDAIIASSTQPLIHERTKFKNRWSVDGGIFAVIPPIPNFERYEEIHVVTCFPINTQREIVNQKQVDSGLSQAFRSIDIMTSIIMSNDIARLKQQATSNKNIYLYAPPTWESIGLPFEASAEIIEARFKLGEKIAQNPIPIQSI